MPLEIKYVKKSCLAHEPKMGTSGPASFDLEFLQVITDTFS